MIYFSWRRCLRIATGAAFLNLALGRSVSDIAKLAWQKTLKTADSIDKISAIATAKVGGEDMIIIAGEVAAIREKGVGVKGLVVGTGFPNKTKGDRNEHVDGFVAQISAVTKDVRWVYRYAPSDSSGVKSKYFDVTFDEASGQVFAVGHKKDLLNRIYVPLLTILSSSDGKAVKSVEYKSPTRAGGNAYLSAVTAHGGSLYMCGTDTAAVKTGRKHLDSSEKADGGLFFMKASSANGSEKWSCQSGKNRIRDRCSGIAHSHDGTALYFSTTEFSKASRSPKSPFLAQVFGYRLNAESGNLVWRSAISRHANIDVQETSMGIAQKDGAVYLSSSKWLDVYRGKRMYLHKLSARTGRPIFAVESCCGDILPRISKDFKGKGGAELARGIFVGDDGFVFQYGSYKAYRGSVSVGYASFVVRTSIFGDRDAEKDSSLSIEKYRFEASHPRMMVPKADNSGLFAVELSGNFSGSEKEANNVKVLEISLALVDWSRQVGYRGLRGKLFAQVSSRLVSRVPKKNDRGTLSSAVANALHLHSDLVVALLGAGDNETSVDVFVRTDYTADREGEPAALMMKIELEKLFRNFAGKKSSLETILGLRNGDLRMVNAANVTRTGSAEELSILSSADGQSLGSKTLSSSVQRVENEAPKKIENKILGIPKTMFFGVAAGTICVAVLIIVIFAKGVCR